MHKCSSMQQQHRRRRRRIYIILYYTILYIETRKDPSIHKYDTGLRELPN